MSVREAARRFGMTPTNVSYWVGHAQGKRWDRVDFSNRKPGRAWNRTSVELEQRILSVRHGLRHNSVLGEYGAQAIQEALGSEPAISLATINRVLGRHGAVEHTRRVRRRAPPKGWYLPALRAGQAELDSFDLIEELKIADGPLVWVLTATSVHGALPGAWMLDKPSAKGVLAHLLERWRTAGLPAYAQFDNATVFQGAHQYPDTVGRVSRLCLALDVVPVFAPPQEPGFQNAIEGFNALWQAKVWHRHHCADIAQLKAVSDQYIRARYARNLGRLETLPPRRALPKGFELDLGAKLSGRIIFLRRTDETGHVAVLGRRFSISRQWINRLVRCEVDFSHAHIRFHALSRRDPDHHPLLAEIPYHFPNKPFKDRP
jgi:hypothetical protein